MSWRLIPPVYSPVDPRSLPPALLAALGLRSVSRAPVTKTIGERYDADAVVLTDTGTSALTLALRTLLPRGGTVAYPGYGCIDLTTAALGAGIQVRLYDLDPETMSPDLGSVRSAIARGVDAIVVTHLYGYPADVSGVQQLAAEAGVPVIEDGAQAAGGTLHGRKLGGLADVSILSFGRGKGTTAGSGGAVLLRGPVAQDRGEQMRDQLRERRSDGSRIAALAAQWILSHPLLYRLPASIPALRLGEMIFHPPRPMRCMSDAATIVLSHALNIEDREIGGRRERALRLLRAVRVSGRVSAVRAISGGESGYLRLAMLDISGDAEPRSALGIVRGYPLTLDQHEPLHRLLFSHERAGTGSRQLRDRLFTAPTHSRVSAADEANLSAWLAIPRAVSRVAMSAVPV